MANADYFFQTIEMAKSDEEFDELCSSSPFVARDAVEGHLPSSYSWNVVKRRKQLSRCQSQRNPSPSPPAPPSTPTSLIASGTGTPAASPTATNEAAIASTMAHDADGRLNSLLYILDYAPKYKKKLKEQQRTDAELAELFNTVTITGGSSGGLSRGSSCSSNGNGNGVSEELGLSQYSRVIRKHDTSTKIFKIHRNPKEFFRQPFEEDSVSAPEYDGTDSEYDRRNLTRFSKFERAVHLHRRHHCASRLGRLASKREKRMKSLVDNFEAAMNINEEA